MEHFGTYRQARAYAAKYHQRLFHADFTKCDPLDTGNPQSYLNGKHYVIPMTSEIIECCQNRKVFKEIILPNLSK
jgi:hypothetical protein